MNHNLYKNNPNIVEITKQRSNSNTFTNLGQCSDHVYLHLDKCHYLFIYYICEASGKHPGTYPVPAQHGNVIKAQVYIALNELC